MKRIYHAENTIDANLVKGVLAQEGIVAHISGEYLSGALGELPALGLVTVMVAEEDEAAALKLLREVLGDKHLPPPATGSIEA
ncbi:MAG: DUF2007 domain-containing protein [Gammaproteobacteria bacterium]